MKKLSIIIPCYNEAYTVAELLGRVCAVDLGGWDKEIIVVDDCSTDGTRAILKTFENRARVIYQDKNGGKGTAVRAGLAAATGTHMLIQDADLEYDPEEIPRLLAPLNAGAADVVYGSRNLRPREREGAWIPRVGVWCITQLINWMYWLVLTDVWTCYKLFPAAHAGEFRAGRFESELLFTAALARRGCRFAEVPISYHPRDAAAGKKIRYRDGVYAIIVLVADRLRLI